MTERRERLYGKPGDRFDPDVIASRVDTLRALVGVENKDVAHFIWPAQEVENAYRTWLKRASSRLKDFELPELSRAVDYLAEEGVRRGYLVDVAMPGFPFVDFHKDWLTNAGFQQLQRAHAIIRDERMKSRATKRKRTKPAP
jgi:hypothetical protein